ncbi:MAG: leucine-rich repeat domain-containing protein [Clostridia bacterium]|nr:leucine-rich repeat domain-containing protein [Clostridia bacterium]
MKHIRLFRLSSLILLGVLVLGLCSCVGGGTLVIGGDDSTADETEATEVGGHGTFEYKINDNGYYEIVRYNPYGTSVESVEIPERIGEIAVTSIAADAFAACTYVKEIKIPSSVTKIGDCAFRECTYLESIVIPDSVTSIGEGLFVKCTSLTSVTLPAGLTTIPAHTFSGCTSLAAYTISDKITEIGKGAFRDCSALTSMIVPATVERIGSEAFYNCSSLTYFEMNAMLDFVLKVDANGNPVVDKNGYRVVDEKLSTLGEYMLYRFSPDMDAETGIVYDKENNLGMAAYFAYYALDKEPLPLEEETTVLPYAVN